MSLNYFRISTRLAAAFGLLVLLCALSGGIGWMQLLVVNHNLNNIVNDGNVKLAMAQDMSTQVRIGVDSIKTAMIIRDKNAVETAMKTALAAQQRFLKEKEELLQLCTDAESRSLASVIIETDDKKTAPAFGRFIQLSQDGKRDEAGDWLVEKAGPAMQELQDSMTKFIEFQTARNEALRVQSKRDFESAKLLLLSCVLASLVFGILAGLLVVRSITKPLSEAVSVANSLADGDMTVRITVDSKDETGMLLAAMQAMAGKLSQIIGEVNGAATNIASASEEISSTAQSMSQATNEQAASVEETSAVVEQATASINQNTENSKVTESMATQAAKQATNGGAAVKETVTAMKSIAGKIGIIDDIAYQTNLLALNAAIEAARAGEHGKGFAVVAAEVRKLAERSQVAAQEIGELASGSVSKAEEAGKLLDEIVPAINKTSDLVREITAASEEQSSGVSQINTAMNQLNSITQQNASATEELAATAEEMSGQAGQLQELMGYFKVSGGSAPVVKRQVAHPSVHKTAVKPAKGGETKQALARASHDKSEFVRF